MAESTWTIAGGQIELKVVVPPNAGATVTLPGSDAAPVEVRSGRHEWRYAYADPDARPPLTAESTIGELLLDREAWTTVTATMSRFMPGFAVDTATLASYSDVSLRQVLTNLPNGAAATDAIGDALAGTASLPRDEAETR